MNNPAITPELSTLIHSIVEEALNKKQKSYVDEQITDRTNITELDKIPDIVKVLRDFCADPAEYLAWRKSVDRIIEIYGNLRGTAKFLGIISVIRNKIIGQANIALETHNTPLNWDAIKECLNTHYADKRDIGTLEYQLNTLTQGGDTIEEFYQRIFRQFALILNQLSSYGLDRGTEIAFTDSYRKKALDTFIRGLNGDLPRLLAVHEPHDLPQALHMCTKLANQNYRTQYAKVSNNPGQSQYGYQGQIPPRRNQHYQNLNTQRMNQQHQNLNTQRINQQYQNQNIQRMNQQYQNQNIQHINQQYQNPNTQRMHQQFFPNLAHFNRNYQHSPNSIPGNVHQQIIRPNTNNTNQNLPNSNRSVPPPRPSGPKPQPLPEPIDIDHSLRSQAVNYSNFPQRNTLFTNRRPNNPTYNQNRQYQNFHINTQEPNNLEEMEEYPEEYNNETIKDYIERFDEQNTYNQQFENFVDTTDINFLG